jgi:hypothetical protein
MPRDRVRDHVRWQAYKATWTDEFRARRLESARKSQAKHRDKVLERQRGHAAMVRDAVREYKSKLSCADCGETDAIVLEFYRNDRSDGCRDMRSLPGCSLEVVLERLRDRTVLCRNCRERRVAEKRAARKGAPRHQSKIVRDAYREAISAHKASLGCARCAEMDPRVLHFHHRDGEQKIAEVSKLVDKSLLAALQEAQKCDILCANCHRRVHGH